MRLIFNVLIGSFLFFSVAYSQNDYLETIVFENGKPVIETKYDSLKKYYLEKDKASDSKIVAIKTKRNEWINIELQSKWGFTYYDESDHRKDTFRIINNEVFRLIDGAFNKDAIYLKSESAYLIYVFLWRDRYFLDYNNKLIRLKSKKSLINSISNECISTKLSISNYSINRLVTKNKTSGKTNLLTLIEQCY
ncbi:hypothetical protein [Brumimicrobium oceani]|uniref:DUF4468 domain-containing protein n=1 Tax=Brumimicrobium oceani TaxID=2100725 RepID=A0A2U2X0B0_9FLAO|nr:hypothetical protein [Brumimicrobium oceani]PWH81226.1 hypothetical protein DIT68_15945 [Brumimicrobium oceani]